MANLIIRKAPKQKKVKGAPPRKQKGGNDKPSRSLYWSSHRLEVRKVKNLMKYNKLSRKDATLQWQSTRRTRIKK